MGGYLKYMFLSPMMTETSSTPQYIGQSVNNSTFTCTYTHLNLTDFQLQGNVVSTATSNIQILQGFFLVCLITEHFNKIKLSHCFYKSRVMIATRYHCGKLMVAHLKLRLQKGTKKIQGEGIYYILMKCVQQLIMSGTKELKISDIIRSK